MKTDNLQEALSKHPFVSITGAKNPRQVAEIYRERVKLLQAEQDKLFDTFVEYFKENVDPDLCEQKKDILFDYIYNDFESAHVDALIGREDDN